jgi:hypothetical protein
VDRKITLPQINFVAAVKDFINNDVPRIVKTEALNAIRDTFANQGFTDKTLTKGGTGKSPSARENQSPGRRLRNGRPKTGGAPFS